MLGVGVCIAVRGARTALAARTIAMTSRVDRGFKQGRGTGDSGQSQLFNLEKRWKDDDAFTALGATDELSSWLGVCRETVEAAQSGEVDLSDVIELITRLQCCLQDVGAHLATPPESTQRKKEMTKFDSEMVDWVNAEIDRFGDQIPPIRQFILSGGGVAAAQMQYARTLARRAERSVVPLLRENVCDPLALKFLNRSSDLLFVVGRYVCMRTGGVEKTYMRPSSFTKIAWQEKVLEEKPKK